MQWYYLVQGQRQGPVDDSGLEALIRQGIVQDDTLVWREGLTEWHAYGAVRPRPVATAAAAAPAEEPAPPGPQPAPVRPEPFPASPNPMAIGTQPAPAFRAEPAAHPAAPAVAAAVLPANGRSGALFFYPVLDALNDGRVIRKFVVVCLKIATFVVALGGVLVALTGLTASLRGSGGAALGGILFTLVILATTACVAQIYWYRAGSVAALEQSPRNTVMAIFAILSRAGGEAAATGFAGLGVGVCLLLWLSPEGLSALQGVPYVSALSYGGGVLGGLLALAYLAVLGFSALILGYLWAECLMLLVDIERNTRKSVP